MYCNTMSCCHANGNPSAPVQPSPVQSGSASCQSTWVVQCQEEFKKSIVIESDDPLADLPELPQVKLGALGSGSGGKNETTEKGNRNRGTGSAGGEGRDRSGPSEQGGRTRQSAKPQRIRNMKATKL